MRIGVPSSMSNMFSNLTIIFQTIAIKYHLRKYKVNLYSSLFDSISNIFFFCCLLLYMNLNLFYIFRAHDINIYKLNEIGDKPNPNSPRLLHPRPQQRINQQSCFQTQRQTMLITQKYSICNQEYTTQTFTIYPYIPTLQDNHKYVLVPARSQWFNLNIVH